MSKTTTTKATPKSEASSLQKLYREAAKAMHPDLGANETDRETRHAFMVRANKAYKAKDETALNAILAEWKSAGEAEKPKATKTPKAPKAPKAPKVAKPKKTSGLDAAYEVLKKHGQPMNCKAIVEEMLAKKMWATNGKTPSLTIYSAILREIDGKPGESRFAKTGAGLFGITKGK